MPRCLITRKKVEEKNAECFYFNDKKFYISKVAIMKNYNLRGVDLEKLAEERPWLGEKYEPLGKERGRTVVRSILHDYLRNIIKEDKVAQGLSPAS